jgi:hypothetical protein
MPLARHSLRGRIFVKNSILAAAIAGGVICNGAWACSSCGCTLNSDWSSQGYTTQSGFNVDLRYDYFNQTQLRSGTGSVSRTSIDLPAEQEIQQSTMNRNIILGVDYSPSREWGVNLQIPYADRPHTTIAEGETEVSSSHSRGIGDIRIVGRYQGFQPDLSIGQQFGLQLPTGEFGDTFQSGPNVGETVDRGLQLGTGTTDLLLGVYTVHSLGSRFAYFDNLMWQQPLNTREEFRPGAAANLTFGLRYTAELPAHLSPQLQLNVRAEKRESGANADVQNSGATLAYLSPGVGFGLTDRFDGFAFLQIPVYQRVNGLQLEPRVLASVGFRYRY